MKFLLAAGADKEKVDSDGWTPLIMAARGCHVEIVRLLLSAGAKINMVASDGTTALSVATSKGHQEIVQTLNI